MASECRAPNPPTSPSTRSPRPVLPKLEKVMSTKGGNGECSYDRMSVVQATALSSQQPALSEAVTLMSLPSAPSPLRIADFGSATGRNAFAYVDFLITRIREEYKARGIPMPEVQAFFNDLPKNDFNTMFELLPPVKEMADEAAKPGALVREYFAAGVPGSFYGRLFPQNSLHFAICMHCLHWISQIPPEVTDPESELYNRGTCWIIGGKPAVARAFAEQSKADMRKFLQSRAVELSPGGILQCYLSGRTDLADPTNQTIPERRHRFLAGPDFENVWEDLIAEDIITAETRDTFNLPCYVPHLEEVRESIEAVGGFQIVRLELLEQLDLYPDDARMSMLQDPAKCAKFYSSWIRALVEPLMAVHMGAKCTDEWFVRFERRIFVRCQNMLGKPEEQAQYKFLTADFLLVVLKKL